jgi:hypothetical protein
VAPPVLIELETAGAKKETFRRGEGRFLFDPKPELEPGLES